jgi:DNA-binding transcriptional ArsR family regulator
MGERPQHPTTDALHGAIEELRERVAALEGAPPPRSSRPERPELGLVEALRDATEPGAPGTPSGTLTYAGFAELDGEALAWQMLHAVPDLLTLDEAVLAKQLAALASPVRIRILRELAPGPLQVSELQARLDEPSVGQLYHHLRELLAAGLVTQPRRSVYELPPRSVIPLLTLLACAKDLGACALPPDG